MRIQRGCVQYMECFQPSNPADIGTTELEVLVANMKAALQVGAQYSTAHTIHTLAPAQYVDSMKLMPKAKRSQLRRSSRMKRNSARRSSVIVQLHDQNKV